MSGQKPGFGVAAGVRLISVHSEGGEKHSPNGA
jgi:hypothetical protein